MSWGSNLKDIGRRAYIGITRGTLAKVDDKTKMQELTVRDRFGDRATHVEHWQRHGHTHVPLEPDKDGEAEVLIAYLGGSPDHPVVIATADRRYRLKGLQPGDVASFDHRGQKTVLHKDGVTHTSPNTITHNVVDKDGKILSTVVQHAGGKKITMTTEGGATIEMDGPNIIKKAGGGGSVTIEGPVNVKGSIQASERISAPTLTGNPTA